MNGLRQRRGSCYQALGTLILLLAVPVLGVAQGQDKGAARGESQSKPADKGKFRRLESVTWNPVTEELTWVVSAGDEEAGDYQPNGKQTYRIHMDAATMDVSGEGRRFSREEAENVHVLMDILSKYAIDSTVWWEQGQGEKLDEEGNPLPSHAQPGKKDEEEQTSAPGMRRADAGQSAPAHTTTPAFALIRRSTSE